MVGECTSGRIVESAAWQANYPAEVQIGLYPTMYVSSVMGHFTRPLTLHFRGRPLT